MSFGKRLIDLAKANLNALLDKAGGPGGDTPIDQLTDDELEAELRRRKERRLREDSERSGRESAERAARERGAQRGAHRPPPRRPPRSAPRPAPAGSERRLRDLYAQLETPYGAPFEDVKKNFRRLMRKYHPDLHVGNPVKHKTATQLTMSLTTAYNELEIHLGSGRAR